MKMKLLAISITAAALLATPFAARADDKDKDVTIKSSDKRTEAQRKAHEKMCQGNHGTVTAKTDNSVTIGDKTYAMTVDTQVNKQEQSVQLKGLKVGDTVCFTTEKAADGSQQIAKVMAVPKDTDKVRVREKESESPGKGEVETPNKKNDVK